MIELNRIMVRGRVFFSANQKFAFDDYTRWLNDNF